MKTDRWHRVRDAFDRVADLEPEDRPALLDEICGEDRALRREVESLVAEADSEDAGISRVIAEAAREMVGGSDPEPATAPRRIGPYRILEPLGSGGMGTVYLAEREGGSFEQRVALKVLRADLNDTGMSARFKSERQILADLRHPNIARLLDGGTSDEGLHYLAMEYVDGRRIDDWCDRARLGIEQRLEIFRMVCSAVQAAHRSLVVHRDLKPANILVTADGHVKLLDFGIAKILGPTSHGHTVAVTGTLDRLLTPAFASPEQVLGQPVTTASDVYSLGVVLYELLVGTSPHVFRSSSATEVERVVCRQEPERPSQAVRRRADSTAGAAADNRGLTTERLARRLAGDLDTIVMTALRKEPERRYPSVEALSEDLRLHLAGLPVRARPDTLYYRAGKFVRRHRTAVVTAVAGVSAVLFFGVQSNVNARLAVRERDRARVAEERARVEAQTADRVSSFLVDLFKVADPGESRGREISVRQLLDRGAARLDDALADEPETRARLLRAVGQVYRNLGEYDRAAELLGRSAEVLQADLSHGAELPAALNELAEVRFDLGDVEASRRLSEQALETARRVFDGDHRQVAAALDHLGWLSYHEGSLDAAGRSLQEAFDMRTRLWGEEHLEVAESLFRMGALALERDRISEAADLHEQAYDMRRRLLGADHPLTLESVGSVLATLEAQHEYARGLERIEQVMPTAARVLGREHPQIAYLEVMRGRQLRFLGRMDEAEAAFAEAVRIERATRGPDHPYVGYALIQLGVIRAAGGRLDEAEACYREALRIYRGAYPEGDRNLANTVGKLAELALLRGKGEEALGLARESRELFGRLLPGDHSELLQGDALVGISLAAAGRAAEARTLLEDVLPRLVAEGGKDCAPARRVREVLSGLP
jgi:serine/threonine-protein kinase